MYYNNDFRRNIDRMFVPPVDYDSIKVETRETADEPILIITLYKDKEVVFFHNYALESTCLGESEGMHPPVSLQ
jgi:hypothetical protein